MRQKGEASKLQSSRGFSGARRLPVVGPARRAGTSRARAAVAVVSGPAARGHGHAAVAVLGEEVADDLVGLVHRLARVGIDEVGELRLAAEAHDLLPEARAALRTRPDVRLEIEDAEGLAHLAAERAALELVEGEGLLRALPEPAHREARRQPGQRGGERGRDVECAVHGTSRREGSPLPASGVAPASSAPPRRAGARGSAARAPCRRARARGGSSAPPRRSGRGGAADRPRSPRAGSSPRGRPRRSRSATSARPAAGPSAIATATARLSSTTGVGRSRTSAS